MIFFACRNKLPRNKSYAAIPEAAVVQGKELAAIHCQGCHELPDPALLDVNSWENGVLPNMGPRLGIFKHNFKYYPSQRKDPFLDSNYYPEKALLQPAEWQKLMSADAGERREAVESNAAHIKEACESGATNFFCVMLPPDSKRARSENFDDLVESVAALAPTMQEAGARLVIEGWPGAGALCCTPESYRALLQRVPSKSVGINYDPSHLLRMGIDPIRFLKEFADHVGHVHGKDCEILNDDLYEYGWEQ
ncbi:MAG: sugar phosphate isomerase/epimerase, partial [Proteobacteria bacterium]